MIPRDNKTQNHSCLVCDHSNLIPYLRGLLKCVSCGFVTVDLKLNQEDLKGIYGKEYFFGNEYVDYKRDKDILQNNFSRRLKTITKYKKGGSLVEVGCAYGFFLELAKKYFDVKGFEICQDAVDFAKGLSLDVENCDFAKADILKSSIDVVTMWDVIEHLADPQLYISKANYILTQGGLLCITTGDIGSINAQIRREKWRLIHPPTHIHYFSRKTLALLLHKHGFDVVYNKYCGFSRSIDNICYNIFVLRKKVPWIYNLMRGTGMTAVNLYLNLYDIMYLIARKR